jgi:glutamyl-tRNA reductase
VPTIAALRRKVERICRSEVAKTVAQFPGSEAVHEEELEAMTSALVKKLLHQPIHALKAAEGQRGGHYYAEALRHLFALEMSLKNNETAGSGGPEHE